MLENIDANFAREQSPISIKRLQCIIDVSHIICYNDLSARIHVPSDSIAADMHVVRRTIATRSNTFCYRHTRIVSHV